MKESKKIDIQNSIIEETMLREKIKIGLAQSKDGRTKSSDQAKASLKKWLKKVRE